MKAILEFDLPDENIEFKMANNTKDMLSALYDISNYLRDLRKGYVKFEKEEVLKRLTEYIIDSKIEEIE